MRKSIIIVGIVVVLLIVLIAGFTMHRRAEEELFAALEVHPGASIEIGARSGNLLTGYNLRDVVVIPHGIPQDLPPVSITFPSLQINWAVRPMAITQISWPEASLAFLTGDLIEPILIGPGQLSKAGENQLRSNADIVIGDIPWNGRLNLGLRDDISRFYYEQIIYTFPDE